MNQTSPHLLLQNYFPCQIKTKTPGYQTCPCHKTSSALVSHIGVLIIVENKALGNYVSNLAHTYLLIVFIKTVHTWTRVIVKNTELYGTIQKCGQT